MYIKQGQIIPQRHLPKFDYCGLTIVMSNPSRFDSSMLLSANGGSLVCDALLPHYRRENCDIRLWTEKQPLLPNTKCVLLFGERAMHEWVPSSQSSSLMEQRGSLLWCQGVPAIATFNPQEAVDARDHEGDINPFAKANNQVQEHRHAEEDENDSNEKRRHGNTSPKNWPFWLEMDVRKSVRLTSDPSLATRDKEKTEYVMFPAAAEIINVLKETKGQDFYFDMETDCDGNILCLAFGFNLSKVYVIPILDYQTYRPFYGQLPRILQAFVVCLRDNRAIAHNGAGFDFLLLARRYRLPIGSSVYDTMLAQHRCYPKVEKSLGHCVSLWTYEAFHKDEADFSYRTQAAAEKLYRYCGKDVSSMMLVKQAIDQHAKLIPGLNESIEQAMSMVKSYMTVMLQGVKVDCERRDQRIKHKDKEATQFMRLCRLLTGEKVPHLISNQKCGLYFHDMLGYEVQGRTPGGKPSLDRKALLKLRLKYENPVLDILIRYRESTKEASMLAFNEYFPFNNLKQPPRTTTTYKLAGAYTFRLSSAKFRLSQHKDDTVGGNLQNWEKETRECLVADNGMSFVQADQGGAEALIVAYLCEKGTYRQLFEAGVKCHTFVALHAFPKVWAKTFGNTNIARALNCSPHDLVKMEFWPDLNKAIKNSDDNPPRERYYFIGKMISHSSNYGAKWPTFRLNVLEKSRGELAFTVQEAREFIAKYHNLFPEIMRWHERVRYQVTESGYLYNLFGFPCNFFNNKTNKDEKEWYAFVPQSTVGVITNQAIVRMYDYISKNKKTWDILGNCHDSYLVQCIGNEVKECATKMVEFITPSFRSPVDGVEFSMKAEVQAGTNWGSRKEKKDKTIINPNGLQEIKI